MIALRQPRWVIPLCAAAAALVFGALIAKAPLLAVSAAFGLLVLVLAFAAPVAHLTLLLFVAAVVPTSLQDFAGGAAGGTLTDVLLLTGLARAGVVLSQHPLDRRRVMMVLLTAAFLAVAVLQFLHGLELGRGPSETGSELRAVIGIGALLIALPILSDAGARARLFTGMVLVGLALGLWGIAQWVLDIPFGAAGDVGVREGVAFTTDGRGQIQGGAYGFPIAVVLSFAAIISAQVRSSPAKAALLSVFVLNVVSLTLTFERAFWIATAVGLLVVIARAGHSQRLRVLLWTPMAILLFVSVFATIAPGQFTAVGERFLSLRSYETDSSVSYRVIESRNVLTEIREHPLVGSGLGATIWWGRPAVGVAPQLYTYTHNGYLWVIWKLGLVGAILLAMLIVCALLPRSRSGESEPAKVTRTAAQAALLVVLILAVTSPVFSTSATPLTGLLLGMSVLPRG